MSDRWRYTPDELAAALTMAEQDPAAWLRIVEADEQDRTEVIEPWFSDREQTESYPSPHILEIKPC
jgi:hypothetical protein